MSKYLRQLENPHVADARHILELLLDEQLFYPGSDDATPDTAVIDVFANADKVIDFESSFNNSIITTAAPKELLVFVLNVVNLPQADCW